MVLSKQVANAIDLSVTFAIPLSGFWHYSTTEYFIAYALLFSFLGMTIMVLASTAYLLSLYCCADSRIQGMRKKPPLLGAEIYGTLRCVFLVSGMAAWPLGKARCGLETGLTWSLHEVGLSWEVICLQLLAGVMLMDAWTYWKHRLLHTKTMYHFHRYHHQFHDPTAFASFAVGPVETVLTFWPIWFLCLAVPKKYAPLHMSAITSFVLLNFYLHCGVTVDWLEDLLPRFGLNSSAWHNVHHSHVRTHYGEISFIWDKICKTTSITTASHSRSSSSGKGTTPVAAAS